jgi:hypothetical protein
VKIDLIVRYAGRRYAIEVKSFTDEGDFRSSLRQAAGYGRSLNFNEIYLVVFIDAIPEEYRRRYKADYRDAETGVRVVPVFVATGGS